MMNFQRGPRHGRALILPFLLVLVILGARLVVIDRYANSTPFADEWLVDGAQTAKPYLEGTLAFGDLFHRLNEHVIFFTRLLVLSLLTASGYIDVKLQMIVNAALDATTVIALACQLSRGLPPGRRTLALLVVTLLNAVPVAWDNILLGFNTHFYLVIALSFLSLALFAPSRAWSGRWWLGCVAAFACYFCLASGALTFLAAAASSLAQIAFGRRAGRAEWSGLCFQLAAGATLVASIPRGEGYDPHHAHGLGEFLQAFADTASWPGKGWIGLVIWLPTALFALRLLRDRPPSNDARWPVLAAIGWLLLQCASLAYGRASEPTATRYDDTFLVGLTLHVVTALSLAESLAVPANRRRWANVGVALAFLVLGFSYLHQVRHLARALEARRDHAISQERNVRAYIETRDASYLSGVPGTDIPLDIRDLRPFLDDPAIRAALPPDLVAQNRAPSWVEPLKTGALDLGFPLIGAGLLGLAFKAFRRVPAAFGRATGEVTLHAPSTTPSRLSTKLPRRP